MGKNYLPPEAQPKFLLLISGKRKCGKDFLTDLLTRRLDEEKIEHTVMRVAGVIKYEWAKMHSLDYEKLLDTSAYKEQHRVGMQNWSMEVRAESNGRLCHDAIKLSNGTMGNHDCDNFFHSIPAEGKPVWICADIRDHRDYNWFRQYYPSVIKRVRIQAEESVRKKRGWTWTDTIDDGPSECDLDDVTDWDLVVTNNGASEEGLSDAVATILSWVHKALE